MIAEKAATTLPVGFFAFNEGSYSNREVSYATSTLAATQADDLARLGIMYLPAPAAVDSRFSPSGVHFHDLCVTTSALSVNIYLEVSQAVLLTSTDRLLSETGALTNLVQRWLVEPKFSPSEADTSYVSETDQFLVTLYRLSLEENKQRALEFGFEFIERAFRANNLVKIDKILARAQPKQIAPWVSVGMLRSTFRARGKFIAWQRFLESTRLALQDKRLDDKKMLRGLQ